MVDARLIVGDGVPRIHLLTTQSPSTAYRRETAALKGAAVAIFTAPGDSILYHDASPDGVYEPFAFTGNPDFRIRPNTTYYLRVQATDGRIVTAQTTTPDSFGVREWVLLDDQSLAVRHRLATYHDSVNVFTAPSNQLVYQDGLLEARFDRGSAIGYQVGIFNLEDDSPFVIDADFSMPRILATFSRTSSVAGLRRPGRFLRLPWFCDLLRGR